MSQRKAVKVTRNDGSVQKLLHHQPLSSRWVMCNMLSRILSLVFLVAVDEFPGRVRKGEYQRVLLLRENNFLLKVHHLAVLHLRLLLKRVWRSRMREEVVEIAVMP